MSLPPIDHEPALQNPSPYGLFPVVDWTEAADGEPLRWLAGVNFKTYNFGLGDAFEVWTHSYCAAEDDLDPEADRKDTGVRAALPDTFEALTVYAHDQCDLTPASRREVRTRASQVLRIQEQNQLELNLSERMLEDTTSAAAANIIDAVSQLETALARTSTLGVIHASAEWAAYAANANLVRWSSGGMLTPLGHRWAFGGGYADGLGANLVATSPLHGWRNAPQVREVPAHLDNTFHVIAERSFVVGYEAAVGAVVIS